MWQAMLKRRPAKHVGTDGGSSGSSAGAFLELAALLRGAAAPRAGLGGSGEGATTTAAAAIAAAEEAALSDWEAGGPWTASDYASFAAASPTRLLRHHAALSEVPPVRWPETFILHAADDGTVPIRSARDFSAALATATDGEGTLVEYEAAGHGEVMLALMQPPSNQEELPGDLAQMADAFVELATLADVRRRAGGAPAGSEDSRPF